MNSSFRILRVRGIEIGANWSWLLVFGLIVWNLATYIFPSSYGGLTKSTYWVMGVVTAVLFVISLLLHELGHAFRAQKEGMEIEGITLWIFGGVAKFKGNFPSAGAEFRIAIAGPLVTLVLAVIFAGMWFGLNAAGAPAVIVGIPNYLWQINVTLLLFNMIPALPLDGGRVLRSVLWHRRGNFASATASAARIARVLASAMVAIGTALFLFTTAINGLFLAFIGFFLMQASRAEMSYAMFSQSLTGVRVRDLMTPNPETVIPSRTIESFLTDVAHMRGHSTYPVVDLNGALLGLVSLRQTATVPFDARSSTYVRDVMFPVGAFPVLGPDDEISQIIPLMAQGPGRAVVMEFGRVVGILSMADVAHALELDQIRRPAAVRGTGVAAGNGTRRQGGSRRGMFMVFAIGGLAVALFAYSPPYFTLAPGEAFDVTHDIHITGVKTGKVDGQYMLTSVSLDQPKLIGLLAAFAQGKQVLSQRDVVPPGVDPEVYYKQQQKLFEESERIAAAAAAHAAGYPVSLDGKGAIVSDVRAGSPAAKALRPGDVITALGGKPVKVADEVVAAIRSRPAASTFVLRVVRRGRTVTVRVTSKDGIVKGAPGIGADLQTKNLDVHLPFKVSFRKRDIGGPSAGLAYAMAIYDLISPLDVAHGRAVATTGTIDLNGHVGPIGGIEQKAVTAKRKHADIFLVPSVEVSGTKGSGLNVRGVTSLKEAIDVLTTSA